jgi:hypothetical protein
MTSTSDRARDTAGTAADEGKHVAGVARDEAQNVAEEAKHQARGLFDDAMTQVSEQSHAQRDRLVDTLRSLSNELRSMADGSTQSGMATDLTRKVADRADDLGSRLDGREMQDILDDVRDFARRRPGMFLAGAAAAGIVAGRLARGAKEAKDQSSTTTTPARLADSPTGMPVGTTAGPVGTTTPVGTTAADPTAATRPTTSANPTAPQYGTNTPGQRTQSDVTPGGFS